MSLLLGIETSCDETAAAVYDTHAQRIVSHHLFSQIDLHKVYGGVVPEIASRSHLEKIQSIVAHTLAEAGITSSDLSAVAVTSKPGLAGALLVGFSFAKATAWAHNIPFIPVNHLDGHVFSSHLNDDGSFNPLPYPHLALSVSGGHTALYRVTAFGEREEVGHTLDDAAGEAFDKVAKLIGLGYPGGPIIEKLATENEFRDVFSYPRNKTKPDRYTFSFSGLKTAILYDLAKRGYINLATSKPTKKLTAQVQKDVASSLLVCIGDIFEKMVLRVFKEQPDPQGFAFVGGVACNEYLRKRLAAACKKRSKFFAASPKKFSTDNGAMIALVGSYLLERGLVGTMQSDIFE
ncbi:MAG: tRNA (adenosine(37)-N6)-threonylcarbamoyltransferase complex transferase subunit TsaD [Candidatus Dependentiae bacterium]|jgi:N6-L-threonylcarbamoyladenine synthase